MMSNIRTFKSSGMIWDDGEIPSCDYCEKDFDNVGTLHETPFSGELVCEQQECRTSMLDSLLYEDVEETTNN
jgi:C4-type Zn-finger protein